MRVPMRVLSPMTAPEYQPGDDDSSWDGSPLRELQYRDGVERRGREGLRTKSGP